MPLAETVLLLACVLGGVIALAFAGYLAILALAAFGYKPAAGSVAARIVVLVPAHDEAALIARSVRSLLDQSYPRALYEVVVIADNCSDATAENARAAGARVLVRDAPDSRGKGRALRWAIDRVLSEDPQPDAVAVVDADSVAERDFLRLLVQPLAAGAEAVQGESLVVDDGSAKAALRAAAFLLINRVRPAGRAALGLPCTLCGNGMLLTSGLLARTPWEAFSATEDLEYSIALRSAGVGPVYAGGAILYSSTAPNEAATIQQQLRWEGGKLHVARTWAPRLVRRAFRERRPLLLDAAFELAIPPLGILAGAVLTGTATSAALMAAGPLPAWALVPWLAALAAVPIFVIAGLRAARAPRSAYAAMRQAPMFIVRKTLGAHRLLGFRADSWVRTERPDP